MNQATYFFHILQQKRVKYREVKCPVHTAVQRPQHVLKGIFCSQGDEEIV